MNWLIRPRARCAAPLVLAALCGFVAPLYGQAAAPSAKAAAAADAGPFRRLAPGVMQSVEPRAEVAEMFSRHDVVELLAVDPDLDWAKDIAFRRDIWFLEFKFKPVRMLWIDIPQPSGKMQRKLIWYLVYTVTNPGKAMHPSRADDGTYKVAPVDKPIRFIPEFLLESHEFGKMYPDRVIPAAMGPIRRREDPNRTFYNSVQLTREIAVGETFWGVATWESIDPRIDRFSIYVGGLTNAYRWRDKPGAFKAGDPIGKGRRLERKVLKLNFWRPGDEYYQNEKEIRYGIPGEVDYEWLYR